MFTGEIQLLSTATTCHISQLKTIFPDFDIIEYAFLWVSNAKYGWLVNNELIIRKHFVSADAYSNLRGEHVRVGGLSRIVNMIRIKIYQGYITGILSRGDNKHGSTGKTTSQNTTNR